MNDSRRKRCLRCLDGLSVGDALGERFFGPAEEIMPALTMRRLPPGPWAWTDDTEMALSIVEELVAHDEIVQRSLVQRFVRRFDPRRGYGRGAADLLTRIRGGEYWKHAVAALFDGSGSWGNGAAMRAAPVGAWFADDPIEAGEQAARSAEVTHAHAEGIAGAVAVAVAAARAWRLGQSNVRVAGDLLEFVHAQTPSGMVRDGIARACELPPGTSPAEAAAVLGSGQRIAAFDTVPFAIWSAAWTLGNFETCFWHTVQGLGDRDTTCAIACAIVAAGEGAPPKEWIAAREPLPADLAI